MKIFILSILVVSFISMCFFKKKFWENRYLVLLIIGGVALVATLTTNYATRGKLSTRIDTAWKIPVQLITLNDSLLDDSYFTINKKLDFNDHLRVDSTSHKVKTHLFFYYSNASTLRVAYVKNHKSKYYYWKDIYIVPSESDSLAYITKDIQRYNPSEKYWSAGFSLPRIRTIKRLHVPPSEYAAIPDSLIRKLPF